DLAAALGEPLDLAAPLRLDRCRTHYQYLLDFSFSGEQLGDADRLDRLAEAHVVREHRAAGTDRERDAVELVRQELGARQPAWQQGVRRIRADLVDLGADAGGEQPGLNVLLGVGIHGDAVSGPLEPSDAPHEITNVEYRAIEKRCDDRRGISGQIGRRAD